MRRWVLTANLGNLLIGASKTFTGFSEDLSSAGSTVCTSGAYLHKHNPWVDFSNVSSASSQPFTSFPTNFTTLLTISFVIPNLNDDMHDGTISQADTWLQNNLGAYIPYDLLRNAGQARSVWRDH
jgi:acid phosphatase